VNTPQEHHGEHEQREGLGGWARRFVETEWSRILDKGDQGTGTRTNHPGDPDPADRGDALDRVDDSPPAQETQRAPSPDRRGTQSPSTLIRADPATPSDRTLPHPRMLGANSGWSPLGRRSPVADLVISSLPKAVQRGSACLTTSRACARSGNGYRAPLSMIRSARCAGPACWSTGYWKRSA
jgi:hypothetical protein